MSTDTIMALGDDQLANQFKIIFPGGIPGGGNTDAISLRMDQSFDPPEDVIERYEIIYKGMKIPKTTKTHGMTKEIQLTVRLDQQWKVFDDLNNWYKLCYDPINAVAMPDLMTRTDVIFQAEDGQNSVVKNIRFKGAKIVSSKIESFEHSSTDPSRLTLTLIFNDMIPE